MLSSADRNWRICSRFCSRCNDFILARQRVQREWRHGRLTAYLTRAVERVVFDPQLRKFDHESNVLRSVCLCHFDGKR